MLDALADGVMIKDILAAEGLSRRDLRTWLAAEPARRAEWELAREASADAFHDEALQVTRSPYVQGTDGATPIRMDPAQVRNLVDTLKWAARIRNPKMYGEKAQLDVNVRTVDLTSIINGANARLAHRYRVLDMPHNSGQSAAHARALPDLSSALLEHANKALADLL